MSYRKRCEIQLQKIKLSLPTVVEKKERFYDLGDEFIKDMKNQYQQQIENGAKIV